MGNAVLGLVLGNILPRKIVTGWYPCSSSESKFLIKSHMSSWLTKSALKSSQASKSFVNTGSETQKQTMDSKEILGNYENMEEKLRISKTRELVRICSNQGKSGNRKYELPRPNSERIGEQVQQSIWRHSHHPLHARGHTISEEIDESTMPNYLGKQPHHKTKSGNVMDRSIKSGKAWCSDTPPRRRTMRRSSFRIPRIRGGSDASGVDCEYEDHHANTYYPAKRFRADEDMFFHPIPAVTMKKSHEKFSGNKGSAADDYTPQYPYIQSVNQGIKVRYKWKAPLAPAEESDYNFLVDNQKRPPEKEERRDARSQPDANLHKTCYPRRDPRGRGCGSARGKFQGLNEIQDTATEAMNHRASGAPRCSGGYKDKGG